MLSSTLMASATMISIFIFIEVVIFQSNTSVFLWTWFNIGSLCSLLILQFDYIVSSMLILICFISFFVHVFSTSYMSEDPHLPRFMSYLSLFTFFMIILITGDGLVQLFIGWEGVGLCSYLLINFWYTRIQANKAAIKAMIINKVGDLGLLLGIMLTWINMGTLNYSGIFSCSHYLSGLGINFGWITFLLLIGVIGKSAQIGLHMWLPDAMEGPTPVSALIHAATMVTAGVFLIIKMSPLFDQTPSTLIIIVLIGSLTAFFASTIGLTQNDLKKVVAYSTCSQLGYMVMICGFSQYNSGLFHLINHGFFKALLFLSAGSIIHALNDEQDFRRGGSMKVSTPFSHICIVIGSLSLMGLPFLTGFYSKDLILELIYSSHYLSFALWLGLLAAFMTALYSFRLIYFTLLNKPQGSRMIFQNSREGFWNLLLPLLVLSFFSLTIGYFLQLTILPDEEPVIILNTCKILPVILSLMGACISIILSYMMIRWWKLGLNQTIIKLYSFSNNSWYFDNIINYYVVKPVLNLSFSIFYKLIDNQILEFIGPLKTSNQMLANSGFLSRYHSGKISTYILFLIVFVLCIVNKI